ncbi:MAG: dephospho-CoA kinase, partial [Syntrophorhabdaceae bacterium]|nr:dephospho-CoA kinase [Syntrophorhabdaceae bacterium]
FRKAGIPVIDADLISKKVMVPGGSAYSRIALEFGPEILLPDGRIDRKKLGGIVFADPERRRRLEAITHPAIIDAINEYLEKLSKKSRGVAMIEATLIHEAGLKETFEAVVCVRCDKETQLRRVTARDGVSLEKALSRMQAQMDAELKAAKSDHVIDNSGSLEETRAQVEQITRILLN